MQKMIDIDQTIQALKSRGNALGKVSPDDIRDLFPSFVGKIKINFDHEQSDGGRIRATFRDGTIFIRPVVRSTQLIKKGTYSDQECTIRFTAQDIRRAA